MLALPIFPASHPASIVGGDVLNFCVRDGNRWTYAPINTNYRCYPALFAAVGSGPIRLPDFGNSFFVASVSEA